MILEIYSIRDERVGVHEHLLPVPHIVHAQRGIQQSLQDPKSKLALYPNDFSLWRVGGFDQDTGHIIAQPSGPTFIAQISSFSSQPIVNQEASRG